MKRLTSLVLCLVLMASCFVCSANANAIDVKNSVTVSGKLSPTNKTLSLDYVVTEGIEGVTGIQAEITMPEGFAISDIQISSELDGKWEIIKSDDNSKLLTMNTLKGVEEGDANTYSLEEIATLKGGKYNIATLTVTTPATVANGNYKALVKVVDITEGLVANTNDATVESVFSYCGHKYDNNCDATCNFCGDKRTVAAHKQVSSTTKATLTKNGAIKYTCSVCKKATKTATTIYYPKTIKLSTTTYTYSGGVKKPSVSVVGSNGKTISSSNYTVSYASGRKYPGKYSVKITFKGNCNYTGSKTLYFTITPKKVSLSSVKSSSKKKATVKWSKQSKVSGYQILLARNSKFTKGKKTVTVKGSSTKYKTVTKLSSKKTYYVKVRSYKTIDGKKVYGSYSKVKKVKVK